MPNPAPPTPQGVPPPSSSTDTSTSSQNLDEKPPHDFIIHVDPLHPSTNTIALAPTSKAGGLLAAPAVADTLVLLQTFQTALGIPSSSSERAYQLVRAPPSSAPNTNNNNANAIPSLRDADLILSTKNTGIWKSVVEAEQDMLWKYRYYRMILSTCLLLQILLGAVLTAMGAARAPHVAITVVSAVTTVVAGVLALMKGQGLPNRCRQDWRGWKGVKDFIQQKEGEIAAGMFTGPFVEAERADGGDAKAGGGGGDFKGTGGGLEAVWREVRAAEAMYRDVVRTVDGNKPDSYIIIPGVNDKNPGWNDNLNNKSSNSNV